MARFTSFKLGMFSIAGCSPFAGMVVDESRVIAIAALAEKSRALGCRLSAVSSIAAMLEDWEHNFASLCAVAAAGIDEGELVLIERLQRHAPIGRPGQILCSGANYRKHVVDLVVAKEKENGVAGDDLAAVRADAERRMDERAREGTPYVWVKSATSLAGPEDELTLPAYTSQADWELELALVVGKPAYRLSRHQAMDHVAGFMIANDVSARDHIWRPDMKSLGTDWMSGKGAPGFLPTGPFFVPRQFVEDVTDLRIELKLNGETMQDETTADMIFDIPRQLEYATSRVRLMPGDILCTGSPAGNGAHYNRFLRNGDVMEGSITGMGTQIVRCRAD